MIVSFINDRRTWRLHAIITISSSSSQTSTMCTTTVQCSPRLHYNQRCVDLINSVSLTIHNSSNRWQSAIHCMWQRRSSIKSLDYRNTSQKAKYVANVMPSQYNAVSNKTLGQMCSLRAHQQLGRLRLWWLLFLKCISLFSSITLTITWQLVFDKNESCKMHCKVRLLS